MSYRTDVAFCIKSGIEVPKFEETENCFGVITRDKRGTLYCAESVKWYTETPVVAAVDKFLVTLDTDDFLFIELDTNDGCNVDWRGGFHDNEFDLGYACHLTFDE